MNKKKESKTPKRLIFQFKPDELYLIEKFKKMAKLEKRSMTSMFKRLIEREET